MKEAIGWYKGLTFCGWISSTWQGVFFYWLTAGLAFFLGCYAVSGWKAAEGLWVVWFLVWLELSNRIGAIIEEQAGYQGTINLGP